MLAASFVVVVASPASAQWYIGAGMGLSKPESTDVDLRAGDQHFRLRDEILDCFPRWFVKVGYWAGRFGLEAQAIKQTPDFDPPLAVSRQVGADVDPDWIGALSIGLTVLGRYPSTPGRVFLYAGAGGGITRATIREDNLNDMTVRPELHATAGATFRLVGQLWATAEYQLGYTPDVVFHGDAGGKPTRIELDLVQHHVLLGLIWTWK
jgi:hypothetical protein